MAKWFAYLTMAVIVLMYLERKMRVRRVICFADMPRATLSSVTRADFIETIPQTGKVADGNKIVVQVDELYRPKIKKGLRATAQLNAADIHFQITLLDTILVNGRFSVVMDLADTMMVLPHNKDIRLRIELSKTPDAILLPIGGFYKDTGGSWVYVLTNDDHFVKRNIKLGAKNPEHFVVLEGLQPGEQVLTSTYENLSDKDILPRWEVERKRLRLM